jgi:hypothetical protein
MIEDDMIETGKRFIKTILFAARLRLSAAAQLQILFVAVRRAFGNRSLGVKPNLYSFPIARRCK